MKKLFFSQSMLDSMVEAGKIRVEKGVLTMLTPGNPSFDLVPSFRFVRTIGDVPDTGGLVGKFRTDAELKRMGAEVLMDSVIYRDVAYQADPGFIAVQQAPAAAAPAVTAPAAPVAAAAPPAPAPVAETPVAAPDAAGEKKGDADKTPDELSKFILDNLM